MKIVHLNDSSLSVGKYFKSRIDVFHSTKNTRVYNTKNDIVVEDAKSEESRLQQIISPLKMQKAKTNHKKFKISISGKNPQTSHKKKTGFSDPHRSRHELFTRGREPNRRGRRRDRKLPFVLPLKWSSHDIC